MRSKVVKNKSTRSRFIILLLVGFTVACSVLKPKSKPDQDPIYWKREKPFAWEDFKAEPDLSAPAAAISNLNIILEMNSYPVSESQVVVQAVFYPYRSWVNPYEKSEKVLTHEIYHFHIEELFARKMRQQFDTTVFSPYDLRKQWWKIHQEVSDDCSQFQRQYDIDVRLPNGKENQINWQKKIDKELDELKEYSNPVVKIKVREEER